MAIVVNNYPKAENKFFFCSFSFCVIFKISNVLHMIVRICKVIIISRNIFMRIKIMEIPKPKIRDRNFAQQKSAKGNEYNKSISDESLFEVLFRSELSNGIFDR